jgi:hypothetical protein
MAFRRDVVYSTDYLSIAIFDTNSLRKGRDFTKKQQTCRRNVESDRVFESNTIENPTLGDLNFQIPLHQTTDFCADVQTLSEKASSQKLQNFSTQIKLKAIISTSKRVKNSPNIYYQKMEYCYSTI